MISHSSTSTFNGCPFNYKLEKIDGLHKIVAGPESNKMVWGAAMHKSLECYYGPAHAAGANFHQPFLDAYPEDLDPTDSVWSREGGVRTLEAYDNYYGPEIDTQWEVLDVEVADDPAKPTLIVDLVARHRQSGSIYLWDHKFKSKVPFGAARHYELDSQISRYVDFVLARYGDCAGAVMNVVVPGYRSRAYKGESAGWYFKFERSIVGRTKQQLAYWRDSQRDWERLIRTCEQQDTAFPPIYPKHLGYNCSRCQFWELCVSCDDPEVREALYTTEPVVDTPFNVLIEEQP